jgi:hypothetical protein
MRGDPAEIVKTLEELEQDRNDLEDLLLDIVFNMPNGSLSIEDVWKLTPIERKKLVERINNLYSDDDDYIVKQGQYYEPPEHSTNQDTLNG